MCMPLTTEIKDLTYAIFLRELAVDANVTRACHVAGLGRRGVYSRKETNKAFSDEWDDAILQACDALEQEARRRGIQGVAKPLFYQGMPVYHYRTVLDDSGAPVKDENGRDVREVVRDEKGQPVQVVEYLHSDALLIKLLTGAMPHKYGTTRTEVTGKDGEPLAAKTTPLEDAQRIAFALELGMRARQALTAQETTFNFDGDLV